MPLFPRGLSITSLLAEADSTADGTVSEGAEGGPIFPTSLLYQHNVHIIVISIVKSIFFSSFNNVDLLHSMSADCCMPRCQEWGAMAAVGGQWPLWLAYEYFAML
jgi:hypothetical protein